MILTVTLNAALDRTVAVPRLALGNRHRVVDTRRAAGGKGVNVARALKVLGEPVIATGFAAGPTGRPDPRAARRRARPPRLRRGRRRLAHEPLGRRPDLGRADRDQRARPAGHRGGPRALHRAPALPRRRRRLLRDRGLAAAGRRGRPVRGPDRRAPQRRGSDAARHRRRADAGRPAGAALRGRPERRRGRGGGRQRVQRARGPRLGARRPRRDGRRGGDRHHRRRAASRSSTTVTGAPTTRRRSSRSPPSRASAPAMPSWPASSRHAAPGARSRSASPTASPAEPSRLSTSAPGRSTAPRPRGSPAGSRSAGSTAPLRVA